MVASSICRRVFDATLPGGPIWRIAPGGDLDLFYYGTADNFEVQRANAAAIQWLRNAEKTDQLPDLEIEFGVIPDLTLTTAQRRTYLAAIIPERSVLPAWIQLQNKLRAAGFDVYVYENDPTIDPAVILAANPDAYLLVNGDVLESQGRLFDTCFNDDTGAEAVVDRGTVFCDDVGGEALALRGATFDSFTEFYRDLWQYDPPIRYRWPKVFWIAAGKNCFPQFVDWHMERATLSAWTAGNSAALSKSLDWKQTGIRSLEVMAIAGWVGAIGPYAEQLCTPVNGAWVLTVRVMATAGVKAAIVVCDKDGVWDVGGIVSSATASTGETLTYNAANGISGIRMYVTTGTDLPSVGDCARFDNLLVGPTAYVTASIAETWRQKFEKMVLRYKPLATWAGLIIDWTVPVPVPGPVEEDD